MNLDHYEIEAGKKVLTYEFTSIGVQGNVRKLIQFVLIDESGIYNLAFGDKNSDTDDIDDLIITNNGDSEKVLATVVAAIYSFCDLLPQSRIFATGSTMARTRLYRMGISKYFDMATKDFEIMGLTSIGWEHFIRGRNYQAYLIWRNVLNLSYEK